MIQMIYNGIINPLTDDSVFWRMNGHIQRMNRRKKGNYKYIIHNANDMQAEWGYQWIHAVQPKGKAVSLQKRHSTCLLYVTITKPIHYDSITFSNSHVVEIIHSTMRNQHISHKTNLIFSSWFLSWSLQREGISLSFQIESMGWGAYKLLEQPNLDF